MAEKKPKKYLAFGTANHKLAYSEMVHLTPENRSFAIQMASSDTSKDIKPVEDEEDVPASPKHKIKTLGSSSINESGEKIKPCMRPDCKDVIRKIADSQERNSIERDKILKEMKKLIAELEQTEQFILLTEGEQKQLTLENNQIEKTYLKLGEKLKTLEKKIIEHHQERDELNNKVMMIESEKQRWTGRLQRAEAALAEMLWKGEASEKESISEKRAGGVAHVFINFKADKSRRNEEETDVYSICVRPDMLDICELPKRPFTSFTLPNSSYHNNPSGTGSISSMSRSHTASDSRSIQSIRTGFSTESVDQRSVRSLKTPTRRHLTNPRDGSLLLNLPADAYRGYTPSGAASRQQKHNTDMSDMFSRSGVSSLGDFSSASRTGGGINLDPVFYIDSARASWGRSDKTGSVRVRNDPPGFRRKLLTAQGHPGLFLGDDDPYSLDPSMANDG